MPNDFRFLIYNSAEEDVSVNAVIKDESIWLSQKGMAELFDCTTDNISLHLKKIYAEGELKETATTEEFSVVQQEGKRNVSRSFAVIRPMPHLRLARLNLRSTSTRSHASR